MENTWFLKTASLVYFSSKLPEAAVSAKRCSESRIPNLQLGYVKDSGNYYTYRTWFFH